MNLLYIFIKFKSFFIFIICDIYNIHPSDLLFGIKDSNYFSSSGDYNMQNREYLGFMEDNNNNYHDPGEYGYRDTNMVYFNSQSTNLNYNNNLIRQSFSKNDNLMNNQYAEISNKKSLNKYVPTSSNYCDFSNNSNSLNNI
jgi:hypothetical protein